MRSAENVEDNLIEKCYCPGDDYTKLFPELNEVVTKMATEYAKMAEIYRPPIQTKDGIPDVSILKGIKSFSELSRDELQNLDFVDFVKLKNSAIEEVCMYVNIYSIRIHKIFGRICGTPIMEYKEPYKWN